MTAPAPITQPRDLSPRVVSLARVLDRLPPGQYIVVLTKAESGAPWNVVINQSQTVRVMECKNGEV